MTTPPVSQPGPQFQTIAIGSLAESKTNPRKHYDPVKMADLVNSAKAHGILEPILCRPARGDRYEVIAGARRFRAAKEAGLEEVPAMVRVCSDLQVVEMQLEENGQREDIHPIDEALGIQHWMTLAKSNVEAAAARISKSIDFVYKRLALLNLIDPIRELFLSDTIQLGHASLLARLRPEDQHEILSEHLFVEGAYLGNENGKAIREERRVANVSELKASIRSHITLALNNVPWDLADEGLYREAGPCTRCPKRSGLNLEMFPSVEAEKDCCLDSDCYNEKKVRSLVHLQAGSPAKVRITEYGMDKDLAKRFGVKHMNVKAAKPGCKKTVSGIYADDRNFGKVATVCIDEACGQHSWQAPTKTAEQRQVDRERMEAADVELQVELRVVNHLVTSTVSGGRSVIQDENLRAIALHLTNNCYGLGWRMVFEHLKLKPVMKNNEREAVVKAIGKASALTLIPVIMSMVIYEAYLEGPDGFKSEFTPEFAKIVKARGRGRRC